MARSGGFEAEKAAYWGRAASGEEQLVELMRREALRKRTDHFLHLVATAFTGGLWFPVWMIIAMKNHSYNQSQGL